MERRTDQGGVGMANSKVIDDVENYFDEKNFQERFRKTSRTKLVFQSQKIGAKTIIIVCVYVCVRPSFRTAR